MLVLSAILESSGTLHSLTRGILRSFNRQAAAFGQNPKVSINRWVIFGFLLHPWTRCRVLRVAVCDSFGNQNLGNVLERAVVSELHRFFRPELIGRFDEKIVFRPLSPDTQREIGRLVISEELARFREHGFDLTVSESAFEFLVRRGIHKALGARPMKRTLQKFIGDAIRHALKASRTPAGTLAVSPLADALTIQP